MDVSGGSRIDSTTAHPARRYNYWLGGKDNFKADRESADELEKLYPSIRIGVLENRAFLKRTVEFLTAEAGIRQFLDIGTGLPSADNTHEVAQRIAADSRIVYVDNDPLVLTHARALLTSSSAGATAYIEADLRDPARILHHPTTTATLDFNQPIAVILVAVLHFIAGEGTSQPLIGELVSAVPSGSYVVATHVTQDFVDQATKDRYWQMHKVGKADIWPRSRDEFAVALEGLDIVEPGIVQVNQWRPQLGAEIRRPEEIGIWGAVARKP